MGPGARGYPERGDGADIVRSYGNRMRSGSVQGIDDGLGGGDEGCIGKWEV